MGNVGSSLCQWRGTPEQCQWRGTAEQWQGVAEHVFEAGAWQPDFRLVCRQWRNVFDARVPHDARPLSRVLNSVDELERAVAERAHERCRLRVHLSDSDMTELPPRLLALVGHVHELDFNGSNITDVSALGGVHTLDLSYCTGITDVSALGGVHTLNLGGCTGIVKHFREASER